MTPSSILEAPNKASGLKPPVQNLVHAFQGPCLSQVTVELSLALTFNLRFPVEDQCVLVGELDGVRIISSKTQELLQEVPLVCQDIFKIASMAPGALLLEAHREYEVGTRLSDSATRDRHSLSLNARLLLSA